MSRTATATSIEARVREALRESPAEADFVIAEMVMLEPEYGAVFAVVSSMALPDATHAQDDTWLDLVTTASGFLRIEDELDHHVLFNAVARLFASDTVTEEYRADMLEVLLRCASDLHIQLDDSGEPLRRLHALHWFASVRALMLDARGVRGPLVTIAQWAAWDACVDDWETRHEGSRKRNQTHTDAPSKPRA
ncbi:MAG: hypothetical protein Q7V62_00125 [Actinomycetota bacterium]|nr:hypothetical protein [Actinomycetota bacterium]